MKFVLPDPGKCILLLPDSDVMRVQFFRISLCTLSGRMSSIDLDLCSRYYTERAC